MPQLEENLWIEGGYYIDFDESSQLRIIGPNNHLYMGLIDIPRHKIRIRNIKKQGNASVVVRGEFLSDSINLYYPAMDDIRTIRELTAHPSGKLLTYLELRRANPTESVPMYVRKSTKHKNVNVVFQRNYGTSWYRTTWEFPLGISVRSINRPYKGFGLSAQRKKNIPFTIHADTNDFDSAPCTCRLLPAGMLNWKIFKKDAAVVEKFWYRTQFEIEHLISWRKTSGDRFGTIFPRDWMETILLGVGDLQHETVDQMLEECLTHIDSKGRGWHEDAVGEFKYEHELAGKDLYDRKMIDIEPLYFLCLPHASPSFLKNKKTLAKLKRVARYIIRKAHKHSVITFKKRSSENQTPGNEYHRVGDWRDSAWAYKQIHPIIAPFSVNVSHYPLALGVIREYAKTLDLDPKKIATLEKKWAKTKKYFSFTNDKKCLCYALALYDVSHKKTLSYKKLRVGHLDEAYLFALSDGPEQEVTSFARRMITDKSFYTPSGPTIVARKNDYGYTTAEYHGLVTWTKQAAFAVQALARHRGVAEKNSWKNESKKIIDQALEKTCGAMLNAFLVLDAVPELHIDREGAPHFYTDQSGVRGSMSKVQLWSAMGFRSIVRAYHDYLTEQQ